MLVCSKCIFTDGRQEVQLVEGASEEAPSGLGGWLESAPVRSDPLGALGAGWFTHTDHGFFAEREIYR